VVVEGTAIALVLSHENAMVRAKRSPLVTCRSENEMQQRDRERERERKKERRARGTNSTDEVGVLGARGETAQAAQAGLHHAVQWTILKDKLAASEVLPEACQIQQTGDIK
jgi:hypothetical protein